MTTEEVPIVDDAAVHATAGATGYARRVFKYGGQTFPDPGAEYSADNVLHHLRTFLPELGHAKTEEKLLDDGTLEITFSKQVARKGARRKGARRKGARQR